MMFAFCFDVQAASSNVVNNVLSRGLLSTAEERPASSVDESSHPEANATFFVPFFEKDSGSLSNVFFILN